MYIVYAMYMQCLFTCTLLRACTIRAQKVWTVSAVPHPFWAESHPPKPQHATCCCHGRQQEREDSWAMNAACRNQLSPGSPSLQETCRWPPLYLQHLAWHQKNLHLLDRDCLHPYRPKQQRAEGCPAVLHLRLSVDHENLFIPCIYIVHTTVHTMYIACTYLVHIWFIHWPTMYMCTDYTMLAPLRQFPLRTRL